MSIANDEDEARFTRDTRVRIAIAKYHGLDGEEWTQEEIADYLNVDRTTVTKYLQDSDLAQETEGVLVEKEAQTRLQLIQNLHQRLDRLDSLEEKISQEKEAVPTQFKLEKNKVGEIDFEDIPNVSAPDEGAPKVEMDVPVPERYQEMPNLDKLEKIWREKRLVQEQLEDLLGLEAPDEMDVSQEQTIDVKYWKTDDNLPEPEIIDVNSQEVADELPDGEIEDTEG